MMVAKLYHNRWQIELFFKWLKQHLKIKKFWGESENVVRIQIYTAITALLYDGNRAEEDGNRQAYLRDVTTRKCLITEKIPLRQLFGKPNYNIVDELDGSTEPTLF